MHFCITFNNERYVVLKDFLTLGTPVSYNGQAMDEVRKNFAWILDLRKEEGRWEIEVYISCKKRLVVGQP